VYILVAKITERDSMQLAYFVINKLKPDFWCDFHVHHCWEIVYNVASGGKVIIGEQPWAYSADQIMIHRPLNPHKCYNAGSTTHYCLGLVGEDVEGLSEGVFGSNEEITGSFDQLITEASTRSAFYKELVELKAREIILLLKRLQASDERSGGLEIPRGIQDMKVIIDREYQRKIDLTFLSHELMLSVDYIRHEFKKHYGLSPIQYLINKRVDYAKHLLITSSMSIKQIAYQCGFENEYYFSRLFKKITNISPREYRLADEAAPARFS
jgi:AraC-like DNA-binding protein